MQSRRNVAALCAMLALAAGCSGAGTTQPSGGEAEAAVLDTWRTLLTSIRNCDQAHTQLVSTAELAGAGGVSEEAVIEALATAERTCGEGADRIGVLSAPAGLQPETQVAFGSALDSCEAAERTRLRIYPIFRQLIEGGADETARIEEIARQHQEKSNLCGFAYAKQVSEAGMDVDEIERITEEVMQGREGE